MNVREVRELVRLGRAIKSPRYHAGRRGIGFLQILAALERCHTVAQDPRRDGEGQAVHPAGWYALSNLPGRVRLRIDFDVLEDATGNLQLVGTAYQV